VCQQPPWGAASTITCDEIAGRQPWQVQLPAGGQAAPMTYSVNGKRYVVVPAGGHGSAFTPLGDAVVA